MFHSRFQCLVFVSLWVSLALTGCLESNITVEPSDGSRNVPVNAAIRVRYQGPSHILGADIRPENFQLTQCNTSTATPSTSNPTEQDPEGEEEKPTEQEGVGETPVKIRLSVRKYQPKEIKTTDGVKEKIYFTDVIAIPQAASWRDTPLEADRTQYCFAFNDVKDEKGNKYLGKRISFTTVEDTAFHFAENTTLDWSHYANWNHLGTNTQISQNDRIIFKFGQAVFPPEVDEGSLVCKASDQGPSQGDPCEEYGKLSARFMLYQIEDYQPDKDSTYPLVRYDLYGLVGSPFDGDSQGKVGAVHSIYPGLGKSRNHITNLHERRFEFQVSEALETSIEREVLKELERDRAEFFSVTETEETR